MKVALLGTGLMGSRMARRLLAAGYPLTVWNRTLHKAEILRDAGAIIPSDPASAASSAEVVILMLADPPAVRQVLFGDHGVKASFRHDLTVIDMSTVDPAFSVEMHAHCSSSGVTYFDAPVLGSLKPAEEGTLQIFAGTSEEQARHLHPLLATLGRAVYYLGHPGYGSAMKMAMNLYLGASMAALTEVVAFARHSGIPDPILLKVVQEALIFDDSKKAKLKKIIDSSDWTATFPLKWMAKDLKLAVATAQSRGFEIPLTRLTRLLYDSAMDLGAGDLDYSALMKSYEQVCSRFREMTEKDPAHTPISYPALVAILERTRALTERVLEQFPRQHTERRPRDGMPSCLQLLMRLAVAEKTLLAGVSTGNWNADSLAIPDIYHYETAVQFLGTTRSETLRWLAENRHRLQEKVSPPSARESTVAHLFLDLADREASLRGQMIAYGVFFGARFRNIPL